MERIRPVFLRIGQSLVTLTLLTLALPAAASSTYPQSALHPAGPVAKMQLGLFITSVWVAVFIFVVVASALTFAMIRFRSRPGDPEPKQIEGNAKLEVIWTIIPVILLLFIAIPTVTISFGLADTPEDGVHVHVVGYQWWWGFEYPEEGFVTANEMRVPVGVPVKLTMESADVIHSFWVPRLAGKVDVVPGRVNTMWFQADEPGLYYGQCAEYCGTSHANMRMRIQVVSQEEYDAWVQERQLAAVPAAVSTDSLVARGQEIFMTSACAACHNIDGTEAAGRVGPDLSDMGSRTSVAAGMLENTPENMAAWLRNPQQVKPGALMPNLNLSEDEISALVAYLNVLK